MHDVTQQLICTILGLAYVSAHSRSSLQTIAVGFHTVLTAHSSFYFKHQAIGMKQMFPKLLPGPSTVLVLLLAE